MEMIKLGRVAIWDGSIRPLSIGITYKVRLNHTEIMGYGLFCARLLSQADKQIAFSGQFHMGLYTLNLSKVANLTVRSTTCRTTPYLRRNRADWHLVAHANKRRTIVGQSRGAPAPVQSSSAPSPASSSPQNPSDEPAAVLLERVRDRARRPGVREERLL